MNKLIRFILTMMVGLMSSNVYADAFAMPNEDGIMIFYSFVNINGNEELEITRVPASSSGSIKIPHSINYQGKSIEVTSIGSYAFQNCCYMTSVVIPESVKYVGYNAFEGCSGLTGVYISDLDAWCNISFDYSFSSNPLGFAHHIYLNGIEIQNLIIPNGTTSIKQMTFFGCSGLKSVSFPNSAKSIGGMAFYGCSGLIEVNMSDNIMNIGEYAFGNSNNLENIVFPNSPVRINGTAFNGTAWYNNKPSGLIYAGKIAYKYKGNMPDNTNLFLDDGTLGIASTAFYGCKGLSSIHLPSGLDYIDGSAFDGCSSLVDFTIPSNVTSIGIGILANCDNLLSITVESGNAYYDSRNSCNAIMDTETNKLIAGCKNTSIPDETTEISARAFQGCTGLTTIVIPNKVKSIDSEAFYGCSNLSNVKFGQNLKSIGNSTFAGCKEIVSLELPHSVHSIDYRTFYGCSKLMSVTIGRSCLNIGDEAFASCPMLTDVFCYAPMAPSAQTNTFDTSISENTTLYVQSAAYDDYRGFAPWSSFRNIISIGNLPTSEVLSKQTDGYSTYCNTYAVDFTSSTTLKAYVASEFNSSTNELLLTRVYNVPAGEGLILKGDAGEYEIPYAENDMTYSNLLKGVTTATTISPIEGEYTNFILANGSHGIGFYTLSQTGEIAAGKAYLQLPTSSLATVGTRGIIIRFNDEEWNATGIDEVSSILSDNEYYDTQGRRLSKGGLKKGIYIVCSAGGNKNGKKIIIR